MENDTNKLIDLIEEAIDNMLKEDGYLISVNSSEQNLCGALMLQLYKLIQTDQYYEGYKGYNLDVEYNRIGTCKKDPQNIKGNGIRCDLILHKRGDIDNLICLEMKKIKSYNEKTIEDNKEVQDNFQRLEKMTEIEVKDNFQRLEKMTEPKRKSRYQYKLGIFCGFKIDKVKNDKVKKMLYLCCYEEGKKSFAEMFNIENAENGKVLNHVFIKRNDNIDGKISDIIS